MRVINVKDIASMEAKENIASVQGTLTKVYDYKTGENSQGPWSLQNGAFRDSTGEIKILFTNQPDAKKFLNREISIQSHSGDKGLSGIYADDNVWKGSTTRQIKVTATAQVSFVDPSNKHAATQPAPQERASSGNPESELRKTLVPILNAFYIIEGEVKKQCDQSEIEGIPFDSVNFGGKCSAAFRLIPNDLVAAQSSRPLWGAASQLAKKATAQESDEVPW